MTSLVLFFENKVVVTLKTDGKTLELTPGPFLKGMSPDLSMLKISVSSE